MILRFPVSAFMPPIKRDKKGPRPYGTYRAERREQAKAYYRMHKRGLLK